MILSETSIKKLIKRLMLHEITDSFDTGDLAMRFTTQNLRDEDQSFSEFPGHTFQVPNTSGRVFPIAKYLGKSCNRSSNITSYPQKERKDPTGKTDEIRKHKAFDIGCAGGTPLVSIESGSVVKSTYDDVSGNYVVIKHDDGSTSLYCHMQEPGIDRGTKVKKGQFIGLVGTTGRSTGNHLHFGFKPSSASDYSMDPSDYNWLWTAPEVTVIKSEEGAYASNTVSGTGTIANFDGRGFASASPGDIVSAAPGCSLPAAEYALAAYRKYYSKIRNKNKMIIVDYTISGDKTRLWCLQVDSSGNISTKVSADVSHGTGNQAPGGGIPRHFSNTPRSNSASVGAILTNQVYQSGAGQLYKFAPATATQGLSTEEKKSRYKGPALRFEGLDSTNSNDYSRAIVFHGSWARENGRIGIRSWGCLATSRRVNADIISFAGIGTFGYKFGGTNHNIKHSAMAMT